jgi:hypothetical protein
MYTPFAEVGVTAPTCDGGSADRARNRVRN